MGTLGGNGGGQPPNGGGTPPGGGSSDGVPQLPPEWGFIAIPDDASELDDEAVVVRRDLQREARQARWRRRLHLPPLPPKRADDVPSLGVPLVIMTIAVVATLISLFAVIWPGRQPPTGHPSTVPETGRPLTLPDLILLDTDGVALRIRDAAPAVVLILDSCACTELINQAGDMVDPRVTVLVVTGGEAAPTATVSPSGTRPAASAATSPTAAASSAAASPRVLRPGVRVRTVFDPTGALRAAIPGLPTGGLYDAGVLLVSADWSVVRVVRATTSIRDLKPDLERLAS
jgi:hypothetical protein